MDIFAPNLLHLINPEILLCDRNPKRNRVAGFEIRNVPGVTRYERHRHGGHEARNVFVLNLNSLPVWRKTTHDPACFVIVRAVLRRSRSLAAEESNRNARG